MLAYSLALDFLWKLLVVASLSSTLVFGSFLLVRPLLQKISGRFYYIIAQGSLICVLGILGVGGLLLSTFDQDLQMKCFNSFADVQGNFAITRLLAFIWFAVSFILLTLDFTRYRNFIRAIQAKVLEARQGFLIVDDSLPAMTYGFIEKVILIPQRFLYQEMEFIHVLEHERTHARNHDGLWSLLALLVQRICWFNPIVWIFERSYKVALEMATDEQTIARNQFNSLEYCQTLLASLEHQNNKNNKMILGVSADFIEMKSRLENLEVSRVKGAQLRMKMIAVFVISAGWLFGFSESFASLKVDRSTSAKEIMCYQVQHEKIIETLLNIRTEVNKCE